MKLFIDGAQGVIYRTKKNNKNSQTRISQLLKPHSNSSIMGDKIKDFKPFAFIMDFK